MKALMAPQPGELSLGDLEVPVPGQYEALVRMDACAICNPTDHKLMTNEFCPGPFPVVLGHEVIGTVVSVGPDVVNYEPGDRVFRQRLADAHVPGQGRSCWGGFAEHGIVVDRWAKEGVPYGQDSLPSDQQKLQIDVEPAQAAAMVTLMETLDCITNCGAESGKSVAVVGSGPVGQALAMFAKLLGAAPVYGFGRSTKHAPRFEEAVRCDGYVAGTDYPPEVRDILAAGGFDVVVEAVGSVAALETCIALAGERGGAYVYGVAPGSNPFTEEQMALDNVERIGACEGRAQARLVALIEAGDVKLTDWVSHCLPMTAFQRAFDLIARKEGYKVVLLPLS